MIHKTIQQIHQMIGGELHLNDQMPFTYISGVSIDSRTIDQDSIFFALPGTRCNPHTYLDFCNTKGVKLAVIYEAAYNKNLEIACIVVEDTVASLQELAKQYRQELEVEVIGITGSNGKTSCKDILSSILSQDAAVIKTLGNRNNEIGVPLTLLDLSEDSEFAVVEMGVENFNDIEFLNDIVFPNAGILTSIGSAHLTTLKTIENVAKAKLQLVDGLKIQDSFIFNGDDLLVKKLILEKDLRGIELRTFGEDVGNTMQLMEFHQDQTHIKFDVLYEGTTYSYTMPTIGKHQAFNAMAAILCAKDYEYSEQQIQAGLNNFIAGDMRNEIVVLNKWTILNDAYKSNPESLEASLTSFQGIESNYKIIVLGDMLDLGENEIELHQKMGGFLETIHYDVLICYGQLSKYIMDAAKTIKPYQEYFHFLKQQEIIQQLHIYKQKESAILIKGSRGMQLDKIIETLQGELK